MLVNRRCGCHFRRLLAACVAAVLATWLPTAPVAAQVRVITYNLLNYPGSTGAQRNPAFRTVIAGCDPHVVVAQEIPNGSNATSFLNNVLNTLQPGQWQMASFSQGPDTNNALFYKPSKVTFLSSDPDAFVIIPTALRDINRWKLRPAGYNNPAANFYVYSAHFKAGNTTDDRDQRAAEAVALRNNANSLPAGSKFLVCGDLNLYTSLEEAYQTLVQSQADNDGRCRDPLNVNNATQAWSGSFTFRAMHTQSTRDSPPSPDDGGSLGGLDDRFDFVLCSYPISPASPAGEGLAYLPNSYTSYGNDSNHFNISVNDPPTNSAVGQTIADALFRATDHLPVRVTLRTPAQITADAALDFDRIITGGQATRSLTVTNSAPAETSQSADVLLYTLSAPPGFSAPSGQFSDLPTGAGNSHAIALTQSTPGTAAGQLSVASNDLDNPVHLVALTGVVLRHAVPSLSDAAQSLTATLDFGAHPPAQYADQPVAVFNLGFDALQALLEVYAFTIEDDPQARFALPAFEPVLVGDPPASILVSFNAEGAVPFQDYSATLRLMARDEPLPGQIDLPELVVSLTAQPEPQKGDLNLSGDVESGDLPLFVAVLLGLDTDPLRIDLADMTDNGFPDGDDLPLFIAAL